MKPLVAALSDRHVQIIPGLVFGFWVTTARVNFDDFQISGF